MRAYKERLGLLVATLAVASLVAGCGRLKRRAPPPDDDPPSADTDPSPEPPDPGTQAEPGHASYFRDATSVPGKLGAKIQGPVRVTELVLYPEYVISEVQDPRKRGNVDRYTLRNGVVDDGEPVRLMGQMKTARDVDAAVVDLASVNFGIVPKLIREAKHRLRIEDGKVSHVMLDASRVFHKQVIWRVYMSSARKSGFVELDLHGRVQRVAD